MIWRLVIVLAFIAATAISHASSEVVVAVRYLQAEGESHAHLFLYREDGTLLRQLTKEQSGQDLDPVFAPDGQTVVFTREIGEKKFEFWSVEPKGGELKRLEAEPEWYANTKTSPHFVWPGLDESGDDESSPPFGQRVQRFRAPDGSVGNGFARSKGRRGGRGKWAGPREALSPARFKIGEGIRIRKTPRL